MIFRAEIALSAQQEKAAEHASANNCGARDQFIAYTLRTNYTLDILYKPHFKPQIIVRSR